METKTAKKSPPEAPPPPAAPWRPSPFFIAAVGAVTVLVVVPSMRAWSHRPVAGTGELAHRMENEGRVLVVGGSDLVRLASPGATLVPEQDAAALTPLLDGRDERAFTDALTDAGFGAVLVDGRGVREEIEDPARGPTVRERLVHYAGFETLACEYLADAAALYEPRTGLVIEAPLDEALAHVARAVLSGVRSPRVSSFPEPLRRIRNVEVMVMLEDRGHHGAERRAVGRGVGVDPLGPGHLGGHVGGAGVDGGELERERHVVLGAHQAGDGDRAGVEAGELGGGGGGGGGGFGGRGGAAQPGDYLVIVRVGGTVSKQVLRVERAAGMFSGNPFQLQGQDDDDHEEGGGGRRK